MGYQLGRRVYAMSWGERKLLTRRQHLTLAYVALFAWDTDGRHPAGYYVNGYRAIVVHGWGLPYTESNRSKCVTDVSRLVAYGYLRRTRYPDPDSKSRALVIQIDALPSL